MTCAVLIDSGRHALEQVFARTVHGQLRVIIPTRSVAAVAEGETVASIFLTAAVAADVAGDRDRGEGGHDQGSIESAAVVDRVVAAQAITGSIFADPGTVVVGTLVAEVDGAGNGGAVAIGDLFDHSIANGGVAVAAGFILLVADAQVAPVGAWPLVGRDELLQVPLVVVARAGGVGVVLQRIRGAAKEVFVAGGVPHVEAGLAVGLVLYDFELGAMLGDVTGRIAVGRGNQQVADAVDAAERVPGGCSPGGITGILRGADGAQGERPAFAKVRGRGGMIVPSVGGGAGVAQHELRHRSQRPGGNGEGIGIGQLAGVALRRGQVGSGRTGIVRAARRREQGAIDQNRAAGAEGMRFALVVHEGGIGTPGLMGRAGGGDLFGPDQ